jgi:hypothetical protein
MADRVAKSSKKDYQKPTWEKQKMFERFTVSCLKHPQPAQGCSPPRSNS